MDYFRIKYVDGGTYFLIKSDNPPVPPEPPVPSTTLFNIIDNATGNDIQCREQPNIAYIQRGGTMFEGHGNLVNIFMIGIDVINKTPDSV